MESSLKFLAVKKLRDILLSDNLEAAIQQAGFAAMVMTDDQMVVNPVFEQFFKGLDIHLKVMPDEREEVFHRLFDSDKARQAFMKSWHHSEVFDPNQPLEHWHPLLLSFDRDSVYQFHTIVAAQPIIWHGNRAVVLVWIDETLLSDVLKESALLFYFLDEGIYHIRLHPETGEVSYQFLSPGFANLLGIEYDQLILKVLDEPTWWMEHVYEQDRQRYLESFETLVRDKRQQFDYRFRTEDGRLIWLETSRHLICAENSHLEIAGSLCDVTEQKKAAFANELHRAAFEATGQSDTDEGLLRALCFELARVSTIRLVWIGCPDTEQKTMKPLYSCGASKTYLEKKFEITLDPSHEHAQGPTAQAWIKNEIVINPDTVHNPSMAPWREKMLQHHLYSSVSFVVQGNKGELATINMYSDQPHFFDEQLLVVLHRIQSLIQVELQNNCLKHKLQDLSYRSRVTGDPNQISLQEFLQSNELERFSLVLLNIRGFSNINTVWGVEQGDLLIQEISSRLHALLKKEDRVFHLGADRFALVLMETNQQQVVHILQRIRDELTHHTQLEHQVVPLSVEFNVVIYPEQCLNRFQVFDAAMLTKHYGQGLEDIYFYQPEFMEQVHENLHLQELLEKAIDKQAFTFVFQPVIPIKSGLGLEAEMLIRLKDEEGAPLNPERFIAVAEQSDMIKRITHQVIEAAFSQMQLWQERSLPIERLALNLSAQDVEDEQFLNWLETQLLKHHLFAERFGFEITERVAMKHASKAQAFIDKMKEIGAYLELDDFGVAHSSLNMINELSFDMIKIDKSFVDQVVNNEKDRNLVQLIIETTHNIGALSLAEGVETKAQYELLKEMGVDYIQGYYFSKPLDAEAFEAFAQAFDPQTILKS